MLTTSTSTWRLLNKELCSRKKWRYNVRPKHSIHQDWTKELIEWKQVDWITIREIKKHLQFQYCRPTLKEPLSNEAWCSREHNRQSWLILRYNNQWFGRTLTRQSSCEWVVIVRDDAVYYHNILHHSQRCSRKWGTWESWSVRQVWGTQHSQSWRLKHPQRDQTQALPTPASPVKTTLHQLLPHHHQHHPHLRQPLHLQSWHYLVYIESFLTSNCQFYLILTLGF